MTLPTFKPYFAKFRPENFSVINPKVVIVVQYLRTNQVQAASFYFEPCCKRKGELKIGLGAHTIGYFLGSNYVEGASAIAARRGVARWHAAPAVRHGLVIIVA